MVNDIPAVTRVKLERSKAIERIEYEYQESLSLKKPLKTTARDHPRASSTYEYEHHEVTFNDESNRLQPAMDG